MKKIEQTSNMDNIMPEVSPSPLLGSIVPNPNFFTESFQTAIEGFSKIQNAFNLNILSDYSYFEEIESVYNTPRILNRSQSNPNFENHINNKRSLYLKNHCTEKFINLLKTEDFEFGYSSQSEEFLNEQLKINALATRNWLNEIFIGYFNDAAVLIGILRIIAHFDPDIIFPQGQTFAVAALVHKTEEIRELGIRAFEQWGTPESLKILKDVKVESGWLKEYLDQVIHDLEEQYPNTGTTQGSIA